MSYQSQLLLGTEYSIKGLFYQVKSLLDELEAGVDVQLLIDKLNEIKARPLEHLKTIYESLSGPVPSELAQAYDHLLRSIDSTMDLLHVELHNSQGTASVGQS